MKIKKKKKMFSIFFIAFMLANAVSIGSKIVSAWSISEDPYEENDDFWSAYSLVSGFYPNLCQGDEDWFYVSIGVDEVIKVSITFDGSQNNIDLELYDNTQMRLDFSWTVDNYEYVAWISDVPQSVYIRIYGENDEEVYDMTVEIVAKGVYDDEYEPNNDFPSASEIYPDFFNSLANNDLDYYKIYINFEFSINIYNTSFLFAQLYSDSYSWITNLSVESSYLQLDWEPSYSGDYYILVSGLNLGDLYDMAIWMTDDWAEPNDDFYEATYLDFGYHTGLIQKDNDWYEVYLEQDDKLEIELSFDSEITWMNIELYDEYYNFLTSGSPDGDQIKLSWTNYDYGKSFYIQIYGNDDQYWYDIELSLAGDDWFEENDDWDSARNLSPGQYNQLFNYDDDFYRIHLKEGDIGTIKINCDIDAPLWLVEIDSDDSIYYMDSSTDDGFLEMQFDSNYERDLVIAVKGANYGDWYNLELKIDSEGDNGGGGSGGTDPFANIPGFPIEIVGIVFVMSSLAVILSVSKKKL